MLFETETSEGETQKCTVVHLIVQYEQACAGPGAVAAPAEASSAPQAEGTTQAALEQKGTTQAALEQKGTTQAALEPEGGRSAASSGGVTADAVSSPAGAQVCWSSLG